MSRRPLPTETRRMGFWGAKVPLPYSPLDGFDSMRKNLDFLKAHREKVGPDYPIMVDCVRMIQSSLFIFIFLSLYSVN